MIKPTLLIMAAGMGSRYGGLKQLDTVGPSGETILDYSAYDAIRAGFGKIVFVIRKDFEKEFITTFAPKLEDKIEFKCVNQVLELPYENITWTADRKKPWGTGHAILTAKGVIDEPFAVINADDFYGASSFQILAWSLESKGSDGGNDYYMVAYKLKETLSEHGTVSRGVCDVDKSGYLKSVTEMTKVQKISNEIVHEDDKGQRKILTGEEQVSMNMWGYRTSFFDHLDNYFLDFLRKSAMDIKAEFLIPDVIAQLLKNKMATVKVLPCDDKWFGVTYKEDMASSQKAIRQMIDVGQYPPDLWS